MVAQEDDSPDEPIIPINKAGLLKNIDITFSSNSPAATQASFQSRS